MLGGLGYNSIAKRALFPALVAGAFPRLGQERAGDVVSVFDFMSAAEIEDVKKNRGTLNVAARIAAAYAYWPHVFFPAGTYNLGSLSGSGVAVSLNGNGGPLSLITSGQAKFVCNTTDNTATTCFLVQNTVGFRVGDVAFSDSGYNGAITFRGAIGINVSGAGGVVNDVHVRSVSAVNMIAPIQLGYYAQSRITGVKIDLIVTDTCTYGFNAQNNGDGVEIGLIYAKNTKRSYFVYGCKQHKVNIYHVDGAAMVATTGNVLLARYVAGYDTEDIHVRFKCDNSNNNTGPIVNLTHYGTGAGNIRNITLDVDIDSSTAIRVVQAINYTDDVSGVENVGASDRVIDRLFLKGRIAAAGAPDYVHIRYQPNTPGMLVLDESIPKSKLSTAALTYFTQGDPWIAYTPVWASGGVQPAIGNGSISGTHHRQGQTVDASVVLMMGSTTTYGTLEYTFSLPFKSANDGIGAIGSVFALRFGVAYRIGSCFVASNSTVASVVFDNGVTTMSPTEPHVWAAGDFMKFSIRYRV